MTRQIWIEGDDGIRKILSAFNKAASSGQLGKVYSTGANQGRGNYEWFVQSDELQAWMHTDRWQTDVDAVTENEKGALLHLSEAFNDMANGAPFTAFAKRVEDMLDDIYVFMTEYPPEPPESMYVRTLTLHHSWTTEISI